MPSKRVHFENASGQRLAGIIDMPAVEPQAFALFCHCFTCTKDLKSIVRISRHLARHGIGVLRFDFRGLGDSQGEFSDSNFETNLVDIDAAVGWMAAELDRPKILIGHSLGGAAIMAQAMKIESALGLVTLAAPADTVHLAEFLLRQSPEIGRQGKGPVTIGGRTYTMRMQLIESFRNRDLPTEISGIQKPHLVLHSPVDETLGFEHAERIFSLTQGPKSLVTLDGSDHLLINQPHDVEFVGDLIAVWSSRFLSDFSADRPHQKWVE